MSGGEKPLGSKLLLSGSADILELDLKIKVSSTERLRIIVRAGEEVQIFRETVVVTARRSRRKK